MTGKTPFLIMIAACVLMPLAACTQAAEPVESPTAAVTPATAADLTLAKAQLRDLLINTDPIDNENLWRPTEDAKTINGWISSLGPDGSWPDIDYTSRINDFWPPFDHLTRVLEMARVYNLPSSALHGDARVHAATIKALDYWLAKDYRDPNWWYNVVGVPQIMGKIMIIMEHDLTDSEKSAGLAIISRATISMTGQNRVWACGNVFMRAALAGDGVVAMQARNAIDKELAITTDDEGLQPDISFHQHGPQLQFGNYGLSFARSMVMWASSWRGTSLALAPEKVVILHDYIVKGLGTTLWNGSMDLSAIGRQFFPESSERKGTTIMLLLQSMKTVDPRHAADYQQVLNENTGATKPVARDVVYPRSDYLVHRRPTFAMSIKMSSKRVIGSESTNDENIQGQFTADGATYLYRTGKEYQGLPAVFDWRRLPGVTCIQAPGGIGASGRGSTEFVGAVSDGVYGAAALDYDRDGVTAKKSWYLFDDRAVCLGVGITTARDFPVYTSVNQCALNGAIVVGTADGSVSQATSRKEINGIRWVLHDGTGYVFLQEHSTVTVGSATQSGAWSQVYKNGSSSPISREVFSVYYNHGVRPTNAGYEYMLVPSATEQKVRALASNPGIEILSNTADLQAVRYPALHMVMATFYSAGQLANGATQIAVDSPCMVLVKDVAGKPNVQVSDPTHLLTTVRVTVNGVTRAVALPAAGDAGESVSWTAK